MIIKNTISKFIFIAALLPVGALAVSNADVLKQMETLEEGHAALAVATQAQPTVSTWPVAEQGRFYVLLGLIQEDKLSDIDSAEASFAKAIEVLNGHAPIQSLADAYFEHAHIRWLRTSSTTEACPERHKAVAITRQLGNVDLLIKYLAAVVPCYRETEEDFRKGLAVLDEAMTLAEKHGVDADRRALIYNTTGLLYQKNNFHDKAYEYSLLAYEQWASTGDKQGMFNMQHTLLAIATDTGLIHPASRSYVLQRWR